MSILKLIASDSFITVNRHIAQTLGLDEAVIIGELASEYNYYLSQGTLEPDGSFYSTVANIEDKTTLKERRQRAAIANLEKAGLLHISVKGLPAKRYFLLDESALTALMLNKQLQKCGTSSCKTQELDTAKCSTNNNTIKKNEIKTINKESKKAPAAASFDKLLDEYAKGNEEIRVLLGDWMKNRKAKRAAMTDAAIKKNLAKLDEYAKASGMTVKAYLDEIVRLGWQAFYPIKSSASKPAHFQQPNASPLQSVRREDYDKEEYPW